MKGNDIKQELNIKDISKGNNTGTYKRQLHIFILSFGLKEAQQKLL